MTPVAESGSSGKYQSARTVWLVPGMSSVELRTVTLLPGGSTGGPENTCSAAPTTLNTSEPTMFTSGAGRGAVTGVPMVAAAASCAMGRVTG